MWFVSQYHSKTQKSVECVRDGGFASVPMCDVGEGKDLQAYHPHCAKTEGQVGDLPDLSVSWKKKKKPQGTIFILE